MAIIDKTKSQTYDFLSENKSIEDILNQPNITFKEKRRHGGKTIKFSNKTKKEPLWVVVNDNLSENEIFYDALDDLNNISAKKIVKSQTIIQEQAREIKQLKNEIEKLKLKQSNVNFDKFKYNAITIYDEKQIKKTGIDKIHEEILPIEDKIFFITTIVHINNYITEEVIDFQKLTNGDIQVLKQIKNYKNINDYKKDILLINDISNHSINNFQFVPIKDFLKKQQDFKLKPTKIERILWCIFTVVTLLIVTSTILLLVPPIASISAIAIAIKATAGIMGGTRIFASLFSPATRKVDVWFGNKFYKNKEQKEKEKKERQSIIKNLSVDESETKLQTQYDILKQELDNRKEKNPDKLINNNKINHKSNSFLENSSIESLNPNNFDSSIRNTVNQFNEASTSSNHNWNKVKCLLT